MPQMEQGKGKHMFVYTLWIHSYYHTFSNDIIFSQLRLLKTEAKGVSKTAQKNLGCEVFTYQTCQQIIERSLHDRFAEQQAEKEDNKNEIESEVRNIIARSSITNQQTKNVINDDIFLRKQPHLFNVLCLCRGSTSANHLTTTLWTPVFYEYRML